MTQQDLPKLEIYVYETRKRIDMYSDTAIEEHYHFKLLCYIILVYNGDQF